MSSDSRPMIARLLVALCLVAGLHATAGTTDPEEILSLVMVRTRRSRRRGEEVAALPLCPSETFTLAR